MKYALAALALTLSGVAAANDKMTDAEQTAVQLALDRGQLLYAYDQAAWHATDEMMAQAKLAKVDERIASVGAGYVVEGDAGEQLVTFYDRSDPPRALFRAKTADGGTKVAAGWLLTTGEVLTQAQQSLARERRAVLDAAAAQKVGMCSNATPNVTILPPSASSRAEVAYVMTPQAELHAWPMGGHYRFDLVDGRPGPAKPFAKSCITLAPQAAKGSTAEAMVISHLLDDTPTEIHVFTMFASHLPVFVITIRTGKLWAVESVNGQARIRLVNQEAKRPAVTPQ